MTDQPSQPTSPEAAFLGTRALEALENASDAFLSTDANWRIVYANKEACRIGHKACEQLIGSALWDEWPALTGTYMEDALRQVFDLQTPVHTEHRFLSEIDNFWLDTHIFPAEGGGLNIFYRDVSERKAAEQRLRQFEFLIDRANDAFFLLDDAGRFVYVNEAACRSLSYTAAQFADMQAIDIDPFYDETQFRALFLRAEGERLPPFESRQRQADGTMLPIEASVSRLNVGDRALLLSCCRDITERKRAEAEAQQAAARQRAFLRDMLASVSEGHLLLCQTTEELPLLRVPFSEPLPISAQGGMADLRAQTLVACRNAGVSETRSYDLATAASEAAMNTAVHAGQGIAQVFSDSETGHVQVRVEDWGGGIALENLPHATLKKGYTTAGTLGHGMKMMLQTADRLFLLTNSTGTTVVLEMDRVITPVLL